MKKKVNWKNLILFLVLAIVAVALTFALVVFMKNSVDKSLYKERKDLLERLTKSSASIINNNITYGESLIHIVTENAMENIDGYESLEAYIDSVSDAEFYRDNIFFFVDKNGKYYSSDKVAGKIIDTTYYTSDTDDHLAYISTLPHLVSEDAEMNYLIFRHRFERTVTTTWNGAEVEILYCGFLYDIDNIDDLISHEFAGDNNTFIYNNQTGVMMYRNLGIKLLVDGNNVYPKFEKSEIVYGEKSEDLINACKNGETVVVSLKIGDSEYYFCSAPTQVMDWSVALIVQEEYLDELSGNDFAKIIIYITLIAIVLCGAVVIMILFLYSNIQAKKSVEKMTVINEKLESATKAKSDFLSNMSHDIRTPINGIMGMTTIARGVEGNPEKTNECLDKIDSASRHLLSLVNDVLDMTRIERGKTEIVNKPVDLRMLCDNCSSIIKGQLSSRTIDFITEIDCAHPRVLADELHIKQILINILGNAVKFTDDGGKITFRCKELSSDDKIAQIAFEVEDTGIGMSPEFLPRIFDTFSQDNGGARTNYKGTGLGMAITKQLTELMGGEITVESEKNKGSLFIVTVPVEIDNSIEPEEKPELQAITDCDITGVKILLVEDNELNLDIATELLEERGAVITSAENGEEAFKQYSENPVGTFDIILMDIMMPVMNGLEATKKIRDYAREDAETIPILAMTANAFDSDIKATQEAGMNAHLSKPIDIEKVVRTIAQFINREG